MPSRPPTTHTSLEEAPQMERRDDGRSSASRLQCGPEGPSEPPPSSPHARRITTRSSLGRTTLGSYYDRESMKCLIVTLALSACGGCGDDHASGDAARPP